MDVLKNPSLDA